MKHSFGSVIFCSILFTRASNLLVSLVLDTSISVSQALSLLPGLGSKDVYTIGFLAGSKPPGERGKGGPTGVLGAPGVPGSLRGPNPVGAPGDGAAMGDPLPRGPGGGTWNPRGGKSRPGTPPPIGDRASSIVLMRPRGGGETDLFL